LKLLLVLLLAVNALLFCVASGWLSLWEARDPDRQRRQVDAERITVISASGLPSGTPASSTPGNPGSAADASKNAAESNASAPSNAVSSASPSVGQSGNSDNKTSEGIAPLAANTPSGPTSCLEFPPLELEKAQAVETSMRQIGISVELKPIETSPSYIVYLAPSESAKEAQRKLAELKRLGVTEAFLMQDGPLKLGISLGLFRAEDGAKALVQQLSAKGIRSAKISNGSALRNGKVTVKASGTETQLARVRQAATEVNLPLKPCAV
jgi:hypothetical protein